MIELRCVYVYVAGIPISFRSCYGNIECYVPVEFLRHALTTLHARQASVRRQESVPPRPVIKLHI